MHEEFVFHVLAFIGRCLVAVFRAICAIAECGFFDIFGDAIDERSKRAAKTFSRWSRRDADNSDQPLPSPKAPADSPYKRLPLDQRS